MSNWEKKATRIDDDFECFLIEHPEIKIKRNKLGRITYLRCSADIYSLIEVKFSADHKHIEFLTYITADDKYVKFESKQ